MIVYVSGARWVGGRFARFAEMGVLAAPATIHGVHVPAGSTIRFRGRLLGFAGLEGADLVVADLLPDGVALEAQDRPRRRGRHIGRGDSAEVSPLGCSSNRTSPRRRHPVPPSHVREAQTGLGSSGGSTRPSKPSNHGAEENASTPESMTAWCLFAFMRTYTIAVRTTSGVFKSRA